MGSKTRQSVWSNGGVRAVLLASWRSSLGLVRSTCGRASTVGRRPCARFEPILGDLHHASRPPPPLWRVRGAVGVGWLERSATDPHAIGETSAASAPACPASLSVFACTVTHWRALSLLSFEAPLRNEARAGCFACRMGPISQLPNSLFVLSHIAWHTQISRDGLAFGFPAGFRGNLFKLGMPYLNANWLSLRSGQRGAITRGLVKSGSPLDGPSLDGPSDHPLCGRDSASASPGARRVLGRQSCQRRAGSSRGPGRQEVFSRRHFGPFACSHAIKADFEQFQANFANFRGIPTHSRRNWSLLWRRAKSNPGLAR